MYNNKSIYLKNDYETSSDMQNQRFQITLN